MVMCILFKVGCIILVIEQSDCFLFLSNLFIEQLDNLPLFFLRLINLRGDKNRIFFLLNPHAFLSNQRCFLHSYIFYFTAISFYTLVPYLKFVEKRLSKIFCFLKKVPA